MINRLILQSFKLFFLIYDFKATDSVTSESKFTLGLLDRIYEIAGLTLQEFLILNTYNFSPFSFCCSHLAVACSLSTAGELQHMAIRFFSHFQIALLLFRLFTCLFYYNFLLLKSPIFRYVTQHKSVVVYRHFGTAYRYRHRRSYGQTPRNNYHHAQHPKEELRPHLDHSRSLQSHVVLLIIKCVLILDKNVIMNIKYSQGDRIQFYIVVVLSSHQ